MVLIAFLIFALLLLITIYLWINKVISLPEEKLKIKLNLLVSIILVIINITLQYFKHENVSRDYIELNKPKLEAKLIIDSDSSNYYFHYLIKNNGPVPAEHLSFLYMSPSSIGQEFLDVEELSLQPKSEIIYNPTHDEIFPSDIDNVNLFSLLIFYSANINDEYFNFQSLSKSIVQKIDLHNDTIMADIPSLNENAFNYNDFFNFFNVTGSEDSLSFKSYDGTSINMAIILNDSLISGNKYICDFLDTSKIHRFSIFIDSLNTFVFQYKDKDDSIYSLSMNNINSFIHRKNYFCCELCNLKDSFCLQIYLNGRLANRKFFSKTIQEISKIKGVVGSDIFRKKYGYFSMSNFTVTAGLTHTSMKRLKELESMFNNDFIWQKFNGARSDTIN